jgi:hypothetical protein
MTRTISLITATVGAALLFAVPAYGDNWGADRAQQSTTSAGPDWFGRAVAAGIETNRQNMLDARERGLVITDNQTPVDVRSEGLNRLYGLGEYASPIDRRERALVEKSVVQPTEPVAEFDARSDGLNRIHGLGAYAPREIVVDDRFRIDPTSGQEPVTVSSGRELELPQIGIGFGMGLMLALGLFLAMRYSRGRELAH